MPLINFTGIASGIDAEALIKATSDVTRQVRIRPLERQITQFEDTNEALSQLKGYLSALQTITRRYSTIDGGPLQKRATSSKEDILTVTASGTANNGSTQITVDKIATAGTWSSYNENGDPDFKYASASAPISEEMAEDTEAKISCAIGDQPSFEIEITRETTLAQFVESFNSKTTRAVASITNVGTSAEPDYRIVITARETGAAKGSISITVPSEVSDPTGDPAHRRWNSNGGSAAEDAEFTITGIEGTIKRSSNTVSDIIPGVTLNLKDTGGPVTVTVADDTAATAQRIKEFINKYNEIVAFIQENDQIVRQQVGGQVSNTFQPLSLTRVDDNVITAIRTAMTQSVYYNTGDPNTAQNAIRIFADLGITTDSGPYDPDTKTGGGTLKFDEDDFNNAMNSEPSSVNQILMNFGDKVGRTTQPDGTTPGVIQQFIRFSGLIESSVNNNKESIDDLNERIARLEANILQQEQLMRARFARLESTIGRMQNQQSSLSSALAALPRNN